MWSRRSRWLSSAYMAADIDGYVNDVDLLLSFWRAFVLQYSYDHHEYQVLLALLSPLGPSRVTYRAASVWLD